MPFRNPTDLLSVNSRVVAGTSLVSASPDVTVHASPLTVQPNLPNLMDSLSLVGANNFDPRLTMPLEIKDLNILGTEVQVLNAPSSQSSQAVTQTQTQLIISNPNSDYTYATGLKDGETTVLLTSEFIPIYRQGTGTAFQFSSQGDALSLKAEAKLLTAATAVNVMQQNISLKSLLSSNKTDLVDFLQSLSGGGSTTKLSSVAQFFESIQTSLTPSLFRRGNENVSFTFTDILLDQGFKASYVKKHSETKLWLQGILETKKCLVASSQAIYNSPRLGTTSYDQDRTLLSYSGTSRPTLNPHAPDVTLPDPLTPTDIDIIRQHKQYDINSYSYLTNFEGLQETDFTIRTDRVDSDDGDTNIGKFSLSNLLKEIRCSVYLSDITNRILLGAKYSFPITERRGYKVWDALMGKTQGDSLERLLPYGSSTSNVTQQYDTKSLASLCQDYSKPQGSPKIVTFEDPDGLQSNTYASGYDYYVQKTFEDYLATSSTQYLDELISKSTQSLDAAERLLKMIGANDSFTDLVPFPDSLTVKVVDELCKSGECMGWLNLESIADALDRGRSLEDAAISQIIDDDIRVPSLICKLSLKNRNVLSSDERFLKYYLYAFLIFQIGAEDAGGQQEQAEYEDASDTVLNTIVEIVVNDLSAPAGAPEASYEYIQGLRARDNLSLYGDTAIGTSNISTLESNSKTSLRDSLKQSLRNSKPFISMKSILRQVKNRTDLYKDGYTGYSGITSSQLMFSYFDMMLRVLSAQTCESFGYSFVVTNSDRTRVSYGITYERDATKIYSYYGSNYRSISGNASVVDFLPKVLDIKRKVISDIFNKFHYLENFRVFVNKLVTDLNSAKTNALSQDLSSFSQSFNALFQTESPNSLVRNDSVRLKNALLKMALKPGQIRLMEYTYGELRERLNADETVLEAFSNVPTVGSIFPNSNFVDYLPLEPLRLLSYQFLSKFYQTEEFLPAKGNNKRLLTIGIPNELVRKLNPNDYLRNPDLSNIVKVKVWKIDRLYPYILFEPKEFLFDLNRFPTRSISYWNLDIFNITGQYDVLGIPTKYYRSYDKSFVVHSNYSRAISSRDDRYLRNLPSGEREKIVRETYKNQVLSLVAEEYLYWYTDTDFSESQYHNYTTLPTTSQAFDNPYQRVLDSMRRRTETNAGNYSNTAQFLDPVAGDVVSIPLISFSSNTQAGIPTNTNPTVVELTDTLFSYLKMPSYFNQTSISKKKIVYPKKFDRVFTMVIDPDDFFVTRSVLSDSRVSSLLDAGILVSDSSGNVRMKDMNQGDTSFYEIFTTIEPYQIEL